MTITAKLVSLNVARPRIVMRNGERVSTGIFKEPVTGRVPLRTLNLDGDRQADLSVHGGPYKAVYVYPAEHYEYWRVELPEMELPPGMFGENFTTEGLRESETNIGDQFKVGSARVMVTQPRMPCFKLGLKFGRSDIIRRFLQSRRSGFYLSVLEEGEVGLGDAIELLQRHSAGVTVTDITELYVQEKKDRALMERAIALEPLPESWRDYFRKRLDKA